MKELGIFTAVLLGIFFLSFATAKITAKSHPEYFKPEVASQCVNGEIWTLGYMDRASKKVIYNGSPIKCAQ